MRPSVQLLYINQPVQLNTSLQQVPKRHWRLGPVETACCGSLSDCTMECDGAERDTASEERALHDWSAPASLGSFVSPVLEAKEVTARTLQAMRVLFASFNMLHIHPAERGWKPIVKIDEGFAACKTFLQALVSSASAAASSYYELLPKPPKGCVQLCDSRNIDELDGIRRTSLRTPNNELQGLSNGLRFDAPVICS